jgi:hypothetical protein
MKHQNGVIGLHRGKSLTFHHRFIDRHTIASGNTMCLVADFKKDGNVDIFVGEMGLGKARES